MITYGKIKMVTKMEYLTITHINIFQMSECAKDKSTTFVFNQSKPYSLFIHLTPDLNKAVMEFTGKILLNNYAQLISFETINQCLLNINFLGFCRLQIDNVINDSELVKCDITKDIDLIFKSDIKKVLISQLSNQNKYITRKYSTTGYTVTKDVKTKKCQLRLSIYDKYRDMLKADSSEYLKYISEPEAVMDYFRNKYRIEVNLITKQQIRKYLELADNSLVNALRANVNPLLEIFNQIFDSNLKDITGEAKTRNLYDYESLNQLKDGLIVKACDNDLNKVHNVLNHYLATNTDKRKSNARFRELINESNPINQNKLIIKHIRDQLIVS